ncbi:TatD family deoxyribonuclease [Vibrio sp. T187]|uniref:TatD family hydrolase n=1 Tax=Vibrio TaxID=662 RepID=UPI0010CA1DE2|nr:MULTISPECIES: TatD family hydrolase [Vibrio]MBW3694222.1 TatD family deoxyribonuclease [Vibrio sp. T187]
MTSHDIASLNVPLFDTHCHFDFEAFPQGAEQYIEEAKLAGVEKLLLPAIGASNWQQVMAIGNTHPNVYFALGVHPYFLNDYSFDSLEVLEAHLKVNPTRCVAVGECGLDFAIDVDQSKQEAFFVQQLELAKQYQLPIILHERKSHNRLIQLLKQHRFENGGVIHGFSGSEQQAKEWIKLGFYIGVGGTITYPRARKTRQTIAQLPLNTLVLETDAPDMPFYGQQGNVNHSKYLLTLINELSLLRKDSKQTIASQLWENSHKLFGICE